MPKLDRNLDAYRLVAVTLERLRSLLRRHLTVAHGTAWEHDGIPAETLEFLTQRRDRETSVKWNSSSGADLLDFAGFADLCDVLNQHSHLREVFSRLVPEPQALRLRFLELDSVLNRIAYARPVSESDTELLLGFEERLRSLTSGLDSETPVAAAPVADAPPAPRQPRPAAALEEPAPPPQRATSEPAAAEQAQPAPETPPTASQRVHAKPKVDESGEHEVRRPARTTPPSDSIPVVHAKDGSARTLPKDFETALKRGDDVALLSALYQEVTGLAETMWVDAGSARSPVWEAVRESSWYGARFSALRLRVVSNFYDLLRAVQERVAAGGTRTDVHQFLEERNFAQVLMDLREFFKPIAAGHRGKG